MSGRSQRRLDLQGSQSYQCPRQGPEAPWSPCPIQWGEARAQCGGWGGDTNRKSLATSRRRKQCTAVMTKPCAELKTAKRAWNRTERRSVMARTADIQVSARRGNTTQELQSEALRGTVAESLSALTLYRTGWWEPGPPLSLGTGRAPNSRTSGMSPNKRGAKELKEKQRTKTELQGQSRGRER